MTLITAAGRLTSFSPPQVYVHMSLIGEGFVFLFLIYLQVTGPTGGTMMTAKASGGQKFSFRAGRRGHYKFCFHNPTSAPEDISFSIHVGHIPVASDVAKDGTFSNLGCGFH